MNRAMPQASGRGLRDQRGGAVVEFAVGTIVMVPLILYGIWFSDALHFATVAEEASIEPVFDATAYKVHDYAGGGGNAQGLINGAAQRSGQAVLNELKNSFDSFDTGASPVAASVFVRPKNLTLTCKASGGNGSAPQGSGGTAEGWDHNFGVSALSADTWVTCTSGVDLDSNLFPHAYRQDQAHVKLFDPANNTLHMCGAGPGIAGCAKQQGDGFSIMLDDWSVEKGTENALSVGSAGGNDAYFNVGQSFYKGLGGSGIVSGVMLAVTQGSGDLGSTSSYRLTYRVNSNGSYQATEGSHGQGNPLGGPSNPHTGGPWHDEHSAHQNGYQKAFNARANGKYLSRSDFPSD